MNNLPNTIGGMNTNNNFNVNTNFTLQPGFINKTGSDFDYKRNNRAKNSVGNVQYDENDINEARESLKMLRNNKPKFAMPDHLNPDLKMNTLNNQDVNSTISTKNTVNQMNYTNENNFNSGVNTRNPSANVPGIDNYKRVLNPNADDQENVFGNQNSNLVNEYNNFKTKPMTSNDVYKNDMLNNNNNRMGNNSNVTYGNISLGGQKNNKSISNNQMNQIMMNDNLQNTAPSYNSSITPNNYNNNYGQISIGSNSKQKPGSTNENLRIKNPVNRNKENFNSGGVRERSDSQDYKHASNNLGKNNDKYGNEMDMGMNHGNQGYKGKTKMVFNMTNNTNNNNIVKGDVDDRPAYATGKPELPVNE